MTGRQKYKFSEKPGPRYSVHHKSNMDYYGNESGPPQSEAGDCHSGTWDWVPYPTVCLYSVSDRKVTTQDNVRNYFTVSWILWKPRLQQIIILELKSCSVWHIPICFKIFWLLLPSDTMRRYLIYKPNLVRLFSHLQGHCDKQNQCSI